MATRTKTFFFRHEGHLFFIYDHKKKTEEDDPKDAILYFYPRSVTVDEQVALVGGIIGLTDFCLEFIPQSIPSVVKLSGYNFAILQHENFIIALADSPDVPDKFLVSHLKFVWSTFTMYQGSMEAIKKRVSEANFLRELNRVWDLYLPLCQLQGDLLSQSFQVLPYVQLHKSQGNLFLLASHILQRSLRCKGVIAGALFNKNKVLCTQLNNSLTRQLLLLMSHSQFPCVEADSSFELPGGVHLLYIFLPQEEYATLGYRRKRAYTYKTQDNDKSWQQSAHLIDNQYNVGSTRESTDSKYSPTPSTHKSRLSVSPSATVASGTDSEIFMDTVSEFDVTDAVNRSEGCEAKWDIPGPISSHQQSTAMSDGGLNLLVQETDQTILDLTSRQLSYSKEQTEPSIKSGPFSNMPRLPESQLNVSEVRGNLSEEVSDDAVSQIDNPIQQLCGGSTDPLEASLIRCGYEENKYVYFAGNVRDVAEIVNVVDVAGNVNVVDVAGNMRDVAGNVRDAAGNVRDAAGNVRDAAGNVRDAAGDVRDVAGDVKDVVEFSFDNITCEGQGEITGQKVEAQQNEMKDNAASDLVTSSSSSNDQDSSFKPLSNIKGSVIIAHDLQDASNESSIPVSTVSLIDENTTARYSKDFTFSQNLQDNSSSPESRLSSGEVQFSSSKSDKDTNNRFIASIKRLTFESVEDSEISDGDVNSPMSDLSHFSPVSDLSHLSPGLEVTGDEDSMLVSPTDSEVQMRTNKTSSRHSSVISDARSSTQSTRYNNILSNSGLKEVLVYAQGHSDTLLILLLSRTSKCGKSYINSLWKSCLSHLAELDFEVKDAERHVKDEAENIGAAYQYIKYDSFTQSLKGSSLLPVTSLANEIVDSSVKMHESFSDMPDLQDITYRSHSASCYGHRSINSEIFFQLGLSPTSSGICSPHDKTFSLEQVAEKNLLKDAKVTVL